LKFLIFTLLLSLPSTSFSSDSSEEVIRSFQVSKQNQNLPKIARDFEIVKRNKKGFVVYVLKEEVPKFLKLATHAVLLEKDINSALKNNKTLLAGYKDFSQVQKIIKDYQTDFPALAKFVPYGKSKKGQPLFALKISDNVQREENERKIMLTAATHGDELITVEVLMALTKKLLYGYAKNPRFKEIIDNSEIYIIPVVNPDGFTRRSRYAGRYDPNRQYPWPARPNAGGKVPSINAIMKFYEKINFSGSIDFHASGKMVMFPWGYTRDNIRAAEYKIFNDLTKAMSTQNNYQYGAISRVIYVAKGSSADYYYWKNNGLALGVELASQKVPSASKIPRIVKEAEEMTWTFLEHFL